MKVALVIGRFSPAGGAERACANMARGLLARGHEVHVYAREIEPFPGIVRHIVPASGYLKRVTFARNVRQMLEAEKCDIVHSFARTPRQDILRLGGGTHAEYLAQTDATRFVLSRWWRRINPKERAELRLEREGFERGAFKKIVAVSYRVRDEVVRHYGVRPEDIAVIHNGVDSGEFKPDRTARGLIRNQIGLDDDEYLLLFCGTGFKRKGLEYAIAAVDRVPKAKLVVVGEGKARAHPRVVMLGRRKDVSHLYAAADALILPTLYDPFPNVCLEAMASGIPVIVSRIAGVSEIIEGDSIVVEDPTNVEELTTAVERLENPDVRRSMGEAARRKALEFTLERNLEENLKLYEAIRKKKTE